MKLTLKSHTLDFTRELLKRKDALPIVGSETVNAGAKYVEQVYKKELGKFTLRNDFIKNSVQIMKSKPTRSNGKMRNLADINAIVGVKKMRGGKKHPLVKQEDGHTKKGTALTLNKVAFPLNAARRSGLYNQPIGGRFKLFGNLFQQPTVGGQPFGVNDKFSPSQRFAIANRIIKESKMFIMKTAYGLAVFAKNLGHIEAVRDLKKSTVKIKPLHKFEKANAKLTPVMMESIFKRAANKFLR